VTFFKNPRNRNDPRRQCTCGFRRFRDEYIITSDPVQRWVATTGEITGMGSTPFGLIFGSGFGGGYTFATADLNASTRRVTCENCTRVRLNKELSSAAIFGSFVDEGKVFIVASDVGGVACFRVRFSGPGGVFESGVDFSLEPPRPLAGVLEGPTAPVPDGPVANTVLEALIPPVPDDGEYVVSFVDNCSGVVINLGVLFLEEDVTVLNVDDADLNGAPVFWRTHGWRSSAVPVQIESGVISSIPFDKCTAVVEYDARFGTLPNAQGWAHVASGAGSPANYALLPGGAMFIDTPGGGDSSYWEKSVTAETTRVAAYSYYQVTQVSGGAGAGVGMDFMGKISPGASQPFQGVRGSYRDDLRMTLLNGSSDSDVFVDVGSVGPGALHKLGWHQLAMQHETLTAFGLVMHDELHEQVNGNTRWGSEGSALDPTVSAHFGDVGGGGFEGLLRNFVVSGPGRFIRAWFRSYSAVASPILRLSFVSDAKIGTGATTARVLVRYGSMGTGASPYIVPTNQTSLTVDFITQNQVFEVPVGLTGLNANEPMWFTVEREFDHADDQHLATVHLVGATIRAS